MTKGVDLGIDDRIHEPSGEYDSKENYQSYLTASNDIMVSCRDGNSSDGKEGVLPIADFIDPNNHIAYANQLINHNQGSIAFNIVITGEEGKKEPFVDFDVGDLLTASIPTNDGSLRIANENRVLSITYTLNDDFVIATIELNANDKAVSLINLPKILQQEQRNRENTLKSRMAGTDNAKNYSLTKTGDTTEKLVIGKGSGTSTTYIITKDSNGNIIKVTDEAGKEVPINWSGF